MVGLPVTQEQFHYYFSLILSFLSVYGSNESKKKRSRYLPASLQYPQVSRNKPHTSPVQISVRLHPLMASQMHPKHVCVTGASCEAANDTKKNEQTLYTHRMLMLFSHYFSIVFRPLKR